MFMVAMRTPSPINQITTSNHSLYKDFLPKAQASQQPKDSNKQYLDVYIYIYICLLILFVIYFYLVIVYTSTPRLVYANLLRPMCVHLDIYIYTYVLLCLLTYVSMYLHVSVYVHVHLYVCLHA